MGRKIRIGQEGRGRAQGGEGLMGTAAHEGNGFKERARVSGERPRPPRCRSGSVPLTAFLFAPNGPVPPSSLSVFERVSRRRRSGWQTAADGHHEPGREGRGLCESLPATGFDLTGAQEAQAICEGRPQRGWPFQAPRCPPTVPSRRESRSCGEAPRRPILLPNSDFLVTEDAHDTHGGPEQCGAQQQWPWAPSECQRAPHGPRQRYLLCPSPPHFRPFSSMCHVKGHNGWQV